MNGELMHKIELVNYTKCVLRALQPDEITQTHIESVKFASYEKKLFHTNKYSNIEDWVEGLRQRRITDIKIMCRTKLSPLEINLTAFANSVPDGIITVFNNKLTIWISNWVYDKIHRGWKITYSEQPLKSKTVPKSENRSEQFAQVLKDIGKFARDNGLSNWANNFFDVALNFLLNESSEISVLPDTNQRLLNAAKKADVFGGMGSWNDSSPYNAQEEYEILSGKLFDELRMAVMYAVNEW